ncbi:MAG: DUF642 domain-containing protein [Saprospiraceae bacterium]|nr:DUF642 domain-containing protein [Saprospiraceae bacterium]
MNFTFSKYIISTICFSLFLLSDTLSQSKCCCGSPTELDFSGLDFEIDPAPPIGGVIVYFAVTNFGPWNLSQGAIDHDDKDYVPGLNSGNPNGPSNFIDLFGGGSGGAAGTIEYPLDGLTPGYTYIIEFYYATISTVGNFSANLKVANGAWLNVSWAASNSGYSIWLKGSYSFVAQSSTTTMSFKDTGASSPAYSVGVLLDDIKIFECPNNLGGPIVNNPPENLEVECDKDIPNIPKLDISDICDLNPSVSFKENTDIIDFCTKKITRQWIINDVCGNITNQKQIIDVIDKTPAQFLKYPENKIAYCNSNVIIEFIDWLKKNGDAIATDACGTVRWRHIFPRLPNTNCDSITVDFIAIDPCGNEIIESAYFLVKDTVAPIFISKPQDKNFIDNINIRDSLRSWLSTFGFSKTSSRCDTIIMSTDFDGDSTKNPIQVKFYVKDRCGNIDSATAIFSYQNSRVLCCCGAPRQLDFPGLDFEIDPFPPLNNYFYYTAFTTFGPWNVTQGTIDHGGAEYCGGLGLGNPNGQSHFIDLFGSPPTGSIAGTIEYPLYGLTPGYQYTIKFWYATFTSNGSFSANLKVANGSWLNVSWTANNPGAAVWLEKTYTFVAQATTATLSFTDTGSSSATYQIGMLIDDITIFECPTDLEKPVVNNPPDDYNVECDLDVPPVPILDITDNCDADPVIAFRETKETFDPCTKKITRSWDIKDDCGNIQTEVQIINIIDQFPPEFTQLPKDTFTYCQQDVLKLFNDWVRQNGFAIATDACDVINWNSSFIRTPRLACDTVIVTFKATDHCGKESTESAKFIVRDTSAPRFILPAIDKSFSCIPNVRDSLRSWLQNFGYSSNAMDCDTIIRSSNFDGDSTKNPMVLTFYAKDRCGNIDSSTASFSYRSGTDTFRITQFSCTFPGNSLDTMVFSSGGCDSVVISEKIRRSADSTYINTSSCDPKINVFDTLRLNNQFGCDSIIFTQVLIHPVDTSRQKIYDCNFTSIVVDTAVFIGKFCDSLVLTEKIPLRKDSIFIQQTSCDSLDVGFKFLNLTNVFGCDSVVGINTTFSGVITQFISKNECGLIKNYTDTLVFSTSNCDSLVITNHIGLKIDTSFIQQNSCDLSQAGVDTIIYQTATCDSIVIVNTQFIPSDTTFIQQTSCDLNLVGITSKLYNTSTCDSLVIINTQFTPSDTTRIYSTRPAL